MAKIRTIRLGNKLLILNGKDPLKYVDLTTGKLDAYKEYGVVVDTAITDWHNGKVKLLKRTFIMDKNLTKTNVLNVPLSADGKSYVRLKLVEK